MNEKDFYYRGNPNIKKVGLSIEWTERQIKEYIKCSEDPIYFGKNYFYIVESDIGRSIINLRDYQEEFITTCNENRYTVAEMSRQSGKTTAVTVFVLWYILFQTDKTVVLLANKADVAREILGRIQFAFELLPSWLQQGVVEWNKGSFVLENGSRVLAAATSAKNVRGFTINCCIIDEAAHIENWEEFFTSVYPTISAGQQTKLILISTVYGINHFFKITEGARKGENDYKLVSVPWQRVPGRDVQWKIDTLRAMNNDVEKFAQEFENEYLGSSGTLISGWKLKELTYKNPIKQIAGIMQYESPKLDHRYVIIADTSRGKGLDYSAAQIIDVTRMPYNQVCIFRDNMISPIDYAEILHRLARTYQNAIVLVENNDIGGQVADLIYHEYEYENVLQTENGGREGKRISFGFGSKSEVGIRTTKSVKSVGCSMIKMLIEQNQLIINDFETISELSTFSKHKNSYEAEPGTHDDLVMGLVLLGWLSSQTFFREYTDINTLVKLREKTEEEIMANILPFGIVDHQPDVFTRALNIVQVNPYDYYSLGDTDIPQLDEDDLIGF